MFEIYKFIAENTLKLTERRQYISQINTAINTAIISLLIALFKNITLQGWAFGLGCLPLILVGVSSCIIWIRHIEQYKSLIDIRYQKLIAMEKKYKEIKSDLYTEEFKTFYSRQNNKAIFSTLEKWMPFLFLAIYVIYIALVVVEISLGVL